jgi:hypothetical protein
MGMRLVALVRRHIVGRRSTLAAELEAFAASARATPGRLNGWRFNRNDPDNPEWTAADFARARAEEAQLPPEAQALLKRPKG